MNKIFKKLRYIFFGLRTLLNVSPKGFFIPYRYWQKDNRFDYDPIRQLFANNQETFEHQIKLIERYRSDYDESLGNQGWFPGIDASFAYAFIREYKPKRIIEVGSGHSTKVMLQAKEDGNLDTEIICIDPSPRLPVEKSKVTWIQSLLNLQHLDIKLGPGDILFIDSSHILMPGTDVDLLFNFFIPQLPSGTYIHIHDIFLPNPYPKSWEWRGYNEQSLVASLLLSGGHRPLFSSQWMTSKTNSFESSLWIEKL